MTRTYGTLSLETDKGARAWHLDVEPHVAMFAKRIFPRIQSGKRGVLILAHTAEVCHTLRWFMQKFPLNVDSPETLEASSASHTGTESATQKDAARHRFVTGDTPLLVMSLRSGAGVDGFQHVTRTAVIGELDWSPGVIEQCIGRVLRDGQLDPVTVYFLMAMDGSDPLMAQVLGLKREQIDGLRDLKTGLERLDVGGAHVQSLAEQYLRRKPQAVGA